MSSEEIAKDISILFTGSKIIGSYLFVKEGLLENNDINDIDIAIEEGKIGGAINYLRDNGYESFVGTHFDKEGNITIHLVPYRANYPLYNDLNELIKAKYNRGKISDLIQLKKVIEKKIEKQNKW
jgi:hypothetical protein